MRLKFNLILFYFIHVHVVTLLTEQPCIQVVYGSDLNRGIGGPG